MPLTAATPTAAAKNTANNATCPRCASALHCGALAGAAHCWCFDLPHSLSLPAATAQQPACLCPACLALAMPAAQPPK